MPNPLSDITNKYLKEYVLCSLSFLLFVVRHCYIQDRATKSTIPFHLWPSQQSVAPLFGTAKRLIILKARQIGLTWMTAAYVLWRAIFHKNELIVIISAKEDLSTEFLDRVKFMFDHLPGYLKPRVYKRTNAEMSYGFEEKDSLGNVRLAGLGSVIKSLPSTPDAGQSKTISLLVMDETAINRYNKEIWSAAEPTLEHSDGQAIIISNPTKTGYGWPWTRKLYVNCMKGKNVFKRIFLDWSCVPGRNADKESPNYFLDQQRSKGLDDDDIVMQYPSSEEEAISSLTGNFFGKHLAGFKQIDGAMGNLRVIKKKNLVFEEADRGGILEIWRWPQKGWLHRYCIGGDVGEGLGGNFSAAYVLDRYLNEFVARMRSNKIEADLWGHHLILLAIYYNKAKIGVERNGPGITTVKYLQGKWTDLYIRRREGRVRGTYTHEIGWLTTDASKDIMAHELKRYYREIFEFVPCAYLLDESSTWIQKEGGGYGPETGAFDDCVMGAGIALQVSKGMPAPITQHEKEEQGWRDKLWGATEDDYKIYDVTAM